MKLALLNTTIATTDGVYTVETITLDQAKSWVSNESRQSGIESAIGHESTAQILSELLGIEVPVNRQFFQQQQGQKAIVFKLKGRPPEGKILTREEIEEIGYEFKLVKRWNDSYLESQNMAVKRQDGSYTYM